MKIFTLFTVAVLIAISAHAEVKVDTVLDQSRVFDQEGICNEKQINPAFINPDGTFNSLSKVKKVESSLLKLTGSGIESANGESFTFACVGRRASATDFGCECVRPIYFTSDHQDAYFFGYTYYLYDSQQFDETVLSARYIARFFHRFEAQFQQVGFRIPKAFPSLFSTSASITRQNGWNWASQPRIVSHSKLYRVIDYFSGILRDLKYPDFRKQREQDPLYRGRSLVPFLR